MYKVVVLNYFLLMNVISLSQVDKIKIKKPEKDTIEYRYIDPVMHYRIKKVTIKNNSITHP
jgi:hypothetical protein